jgi:hypothetical protein
MDGSTTTPSPQLLEANRRLYELRDQARMQRLAIGLPVDQGCATGDDLPWDIAAPEQMTTAELIATLPSHLGWGSAALTAVLRRQSRESGCNGEERRMSSGESEETATSTGSVQAVAGGGAISSPQAGLGSNRPSSAESPQTNSWVKLYPDIGLGMLRQEMTAPGRLWLMLRCLDGEGRGMLRVDIIRKQLTKKTSATYLCTWRQLRNLLGDGEGVYWQRDEEYVWLRSAAKVAYGLGVTRLTGRPVALPLEALLNGIGRFRAELYAAFHSGRVKSAPDGQEQVSPIARETLTTLSGVGETTQRRYEEQLSQVETAVEVQPNYAIGRRASESELEEKGWTQGQALFVLEDFRGRQGPKGEQYVAWQLPNSYTGNHQQRPKGRQRRINRQLKDLVMKGMPGNRGQADEAMRATKLYYPNGKLAAQAFNRRKVDSCYWRQGDGGSGRFSERRTDHYALWQHLEVSGGVSRG